MAYKITNEMGLLLLIVVVRCRRRRRLRRLDIVGLCYFLPRFASSAGLLFLRHGITDNKISFRCALCTTARERKKHDAMFCQQICAFVYFVSRENKERDFRFLFFLAF